MTTAGDSSALSPLDPREAWLAGVEEQSKLFREQKAAGLTARAKTIGLERRREHRLSGLVARGDTGGVRGASFDSKWHLDRAKGALDAFKRIGSCGDEHGYRVELTCRGCENKQVIPVGCSQVFFCALCRSKEIGRVRFGMRRRWEGLIEAADRIGLFDKSREHKRGGKLFLTFWTFTGPHTDERGRLILPAERVRRLYAAWSKFVRRLRENEIWPRLPDDLTDVWLERADGELVQQTLRNFYQIERATEWTAATERGGDGFGHPHFHALMLSPYLHHSRVSELWTEAYNDANGSAYEKPLMVHVTPVKNAQGGHWRTGDWRASLRGAIDEVCKYLVKDWELQGGLVPVDIMASVYCAFDGRRRRQSTPGLAHFAVAVLKQCAKCLHESECGHWARVSVSHTLSKQFGGPRLPWAQGPPLPPAPDESELSTYEWMAQRAAQLHHDRWLDTPEGRSFVERMRAV